MKILILLVLLCACALQAQTRMGTTVISGSGSSAYMSGVNGSTTSSAVYLDVTDFRPRGHFYGVTP